jgi:hypothetical protein
MMPQQLKDFDETSIKLIEGNFLYLAKFANKSQMAD